MAIENTYLLGKNITLGCGFDLQAKAPLDSRMTVETYAGLAALVNGNAAYEGMRVFVETGAEKGNYQYLNGEWKNELAELKTLIESTATAAMEFKGAATALPENPARGDMYKVTAAFKVGEEDVKVGDSIVYDGDQWFIIPSGDDIEDTWRPVTDVNNDSTLTFVAGDKLEKTVTADGTITYKHVAIDAPTNMNEEGDEQTRTYITQLITDNHGHVIGFKTATENVEDTNTTYEFEGQSDEATSVYFQVKSSDAEAAEVVYLNAYSKNEADEALANAVAEVKEDSSNKAAAALGEAKTYADGKDAAIEAAQKAADDITEYVGTFTHDTAKTVVEYINAKTDGIATSGNLEALGQRVTANEGKIADLETESAKHALKTELEAVDAKFADYKTAEAQKAIDDEQDRRLGVIEGDYLKAADIADFETKENVKKVADDLAAYVESNDAALAAETKARSEADAGFETRIANLEANFGDGEGTVEAQIAAAVAAEAEIARAAEKANADDIDALEGRMDTAEGKITALETESAKHALKTEVEAVDAKFADYTKTADLPTDLGDFTNNAGYAKTADVNAELDKKADKTQVATDIANAIAPLATTEALNGVDAKFANYTNTTDMNVKFDLKADKTQVATDIADAIAPLATTEALNGVKATAEAATTVEEVDAQIDAKITALNLATTYEPIGAETRAKAYADGLITEANLDQYTTEQEVKDIVDDVIKTATSKETLDSLVELVEYIDTHSGDAINMATAIGVLEGKVEVIEEKPAYDITATQISNWDNEVGAKALAETKVDQSTYIQYVADHVLDYTNAQIDAAIDADVAAAIAAEVSRADGAYDAKGSAANAQIAATVAAANALDAAKTEIATAIADAKTEAANQDIAILAEAQNGIAAVQTAIDTYKVDNDAAVALKANASDVYDKSETFTQDEVNAAIEAAVTAAMQWAEF